MAREDCAVCRGTGWKLVGGRMAPGQRGGGVRVRNGRARRLGDGTSADPKRYEHCDLRATRRTWRTEDLEFGARQSLKQAKLLMQGFVREYPATEKGLLLMGLRAWGKRIWRGGIEGTDPAGHGGLFLRLPGVV